MSDTWAADYHERLLNATPLADGLFIDNSHGKLPFAHVGEGVHGDRSPTTSRP